MSNVEITNHDEIRRWVEERGGKPAHAKRTSSLRVDFGDDEGLEDVDWETWFDELEEGKLALLVEEETGQGELNRWSAIVPRQQPATS